MSCLLTATLHIVDVCLTCLINITYLLTYLLVYINHDTCYTLQQFNSPSEEVAARMLRFVVRGTASWVAEQGDAIACRTHSQINALTNLRYLSDDRGKNVLDLFKISLRFSLSRTTEGNVRRCLLVICLFAHLSVRRMTRTVVDWFRSNFSVDDFWGSDQSIGFLAHPGHRGLKIWIPHLSERPNLTLQ